MEIFDYDNVLLLPRKCRVESRSECDASVELGGRSFRIPVVPANMKTVVDEKICTWMAQNGYFYVMHRFDLDNLQFVKDMHAKGCYASISLGVKKPDLLKGGRYHNLSDLMGLPVEGHTDLREPPLPPLPHPALTGVALEAYRDDLYSSEDIGFGFGALEWLSAYKTYDAFPTVANTFTEYVIRTIDEGNDAAYARFDIDLNDQLTIVTGARFEKKELNASAQDLRVARQRLTTAHLSYDGWYPSLNLKYTPRRNVVIRAGASRTIGHRSMRRSKISWAMPTRWTGSSMISGTICSSSRSPTRSLTMSRASASRRVARSARSGRSCLASQVPRVWSCWVWACSSDRSTSRSDRSLLNCFCKAGRSYLPGFRELIR